MTAPHSLIQPRSGMRIGSVAGIPIYLSSSWLPGLMMLGFLFYSSFARIRTGRSVALLVVAALVILIISVVLHELAHGLTARRFHHRVHHVTLTPWGGYTYTTTYTPKPLATAVIAVAGPATNLVLYGLTSALISLMPSAELEIIMWLASWINLGLGVFNLLPGLPLDGGHVVEAAVWGITGDHTRGMTIAAWCGRIVAIAVIVYFAAGPLLDGGGLYDIIWTVFIGIMLWQSASAGIRMAKSRAILDKLLAAGTSRPALLVPSGTLLGDAYRHAPDLRTTLLVWDGATIVGWVPPIVLDAAAAAMPVNAFCQPCAPTPIDVTLDTRVTDIVIGMTMEHQPAVPLRLPSGEPRLLVVVDVEQARRIG